MNPYNRNIKKLSKQLMTILLVACFAIFVVNYAIPFYTDTKSLAFLATDVDENSLCFLILFVLEGFVGTSFFIIGVGVFFNILFNKNL